MQGKAAGAPGLEGSNGQTKLAHHHKFGEVSYGEGDVLKRDFGGRLRMKGHIIIDQDPWIDKKGNNKLFLVREDHKGRYVNSWMDWNDSRKELEIKRIFDPSQGRRHPSFVSWRWFLRR